MPLAVVWIGVEHRAPNGKSGAGASTRGETGVPTGTPEGVAVLEGEGEGPGVKVADVAGEGVGFTATGWDAQPAISTIANGTRRIFMGPRA